MDFFKPRKTKKSNDKEESQVKEKARSYDKNKRIRSVQPTWLKEFTWLR